METTVKTTVGEFDWNAYENDEFQNKVYDLSVAYDRAVVKFVRTASKRDGDLKIFVSKGYAYVRNRKSRRPLRMTHDEVSALHEIKDRYRDIVDYFKSKGVEMYLHLGTVLRTWDTYSLEEYDSSYWHVSHR